AAHGALWAGSAHAGPPKSARDAVPENLPPRPPPPSSSLRTREWNADSSARTSSGSSCSALEVEPTRSQKTTVTTFRSSTRSGASAKRWPHSEQNLAAAAFSEPHDGQTLITPRDTAIS